MLENLQKYNIILASKSPRRRQLLADLGIEFTCAVRELDEVYPSGLSMEEISGYLAELKASAFEPDLERNTLVITSDTIVYLDGTVLGKPKDYEEAFEMIEKLSGKKHQVATGVCLLSSEFKKSFTAVTDVYFKQLSKNEIDYYVTNFKPYDKAGAYGIQEWIGFIGIEKIEGSYFNVMGLPVQRLYEELSRL